VKSFGDAREFGIEPAAATFPQNLDRLSSTLLGGKHIEVLRYGQNSRLNGNSASDTPLGVAASVPMFVESAHRLRGSVAQSQLAQNVCTAVAAKADHRLVVLMLGEADAQNGCGPLNRSGIREYSAPQQLQG